MTTDPKRVEALFAAALEQPPAARAAFLGQACGDDAALRERVERLLQAHRQAGAFLEEPAGDLGDSAVLDTPTQAFDSTNAAGQQPESSPPTQAETLKPPEEADLSFLSPSSKPGSLGRLAHYEVQEVLGKGGFGTVFKAFDELLHRVVAIKVMAPQMAATAAARHRFLREARAGAAVRHQHIIDIHAVAKEEEPLPYLVMEYVSGQTLQEKLDAVGPLEVKEILRIGMQIARGLAAAHKQGLIHRDIKPGNILLENGIEHVKITDFGLARAMDDASVTQSGVVAGTPMYMSPEQAEGLTLDHRSDLFSLGTVLYAMCTGRPPFRASGTIAVLKRVVEEKPRPIRDINSEIPPWLCDAVEKLHAKRPEERYQTANEVAELLAKYLAEIQLHGGVIPSPGEGGAEALRSPGEAAKDGVAAAGASSAAGGQPRPPSRLRRWAAAAAVFAAIVGAAWWFNPQLALFVRNSGYLWIDGKNAWELEWVLSRDGEVVKEFKGLGFQGFDLPPGDYVLQPSKLQPDASVRFDMKTTGLLSGGARWEDGDRLNFAVARGEYVKIQVDLIRGQAQAAEPGWVQLFNGKNLTNWRASKQENWAVKDSILSGSGDSYLYTTKRYRDFHLRASLRLSANSLASIPFRVRSGMHGEMGMVGGNVTLAVYDGAKTTEVARNNQELTKANTWFDVDLVVRGNKVTAQIDGMPATEAVLEGLPDNGHINLGAYTPGMVVEFKKIEIKELPPAPLLTIPESADQVLPALAGAWKGEYTQKIYAGKPDVKKFSAVAVNDWIVGQKWLRQRAQLENEGFQSVTTFEPGSKSFRDWFFHSRGLIFGPSTGRWDPATRTITWTNLPDAGVILLMTLRFVDADTFAGEILIRNKEGQTDFEMSSLMKRTTENITIDENVAAGPLPKEMAVLDRLVGDWQTSGVIKDAKNPDGLKANWQSSVRKILGGRVIATQRTGYPGDDESYSLSTFDTFSKAYGRWSFRADGSVMEYGGLWDEDNQTLKWHWAGKDGSQSSNTWPLRDLNRRDWQVHTKNALGKTTFEVQATSVRQGEPGWVQLFNGKDTSAWDMHLSSNWKFENGVLSSKGGELLPLRQQFKDCRIKVEARYFGGEAYVRLGPQGIQEPGGKLRFAHHLIHLHNEVGDAQTGSITVHVDKKTHVAKTLQERTRPGEWFTLEVLYQGKRVQTWVNGQPTADFAYPDPGKYLAGTVLSIGVIGKGGELEIRKVEVKELPPEGSPLLAVAPFDAAKAKEHQQAWAKHLGVEPEITNSIGMKLRLIPPGKNTLGDNGKAASAAPFYLGATEVTVEQFRRFVEETKHETIGEKSKRGGVHVNAGKKGKQDAKFIWSHPDFVRGVDHPVTLVTWHDAMAFCEWLSRKEGRTYRLPRSEEWRWAERAGAAGRFYFGDKEADLEAHAWHVGNAKGQVQSVASKEPNPWGLFDMYGNLWELTHEWLRDDKSIDPAEAKEGPAAGDRVNFLGGSFHDPGESTTGFGWAPAHQPHSHIGFRIAIVGNLKAKPPAKTAEQAAPFVVVARDARAEQKFALLAEAVASAQSGDTIEIRSNGPFATKPVALQKKALTVRIAPGAAPILRLSVNDGEEPGPLFETEAPLVLAGLTLEEDGRFSPKPERRALVLARRGPVYAANCRFIAGKFWSALSLSETSHGELRNCEFLGPDLHVAVGWDCPPEGQLILDNCTVLAKYHGLLIHQGRPLDKDVTVQLRHCTIAADMPINYWCRAPLPDLLQRLARKEARPMHIEVEETVFDPYWNVLDFRQIDQAQGLSLEAAQAAVPKVIGWRGKRNLYPASNRLLFLSAVQNNVESKPFAAAPDLLKLADWQRFWGDSESGSVEGRISFQGGNLATKARSGVEHLRPDDFGLHPESAGKGTGGKDIGAVVDLVGPGLAYEKWQKTPEHQQWLKDTGMPAEN